MAKRIWLLVVLGTAFSPTSLAMASPASQPQWNGKPIKTGPIEAVIEHAAGGFLCEQDQKALRALTGKTTRNTVLPAVNATGVNGNS